MSANPLRRFLFSRIRRSVVKRAKEKSDALGRPPTIAELGKVQLVGFGSRLWLMLVGSFFLWFALEVMFEASWWIAAIIGIASGYVFWRGLVGHSLDLTLLLRSGDGESARFEPDAPFDEDLLDAEFESSLWTLQLSFMMVEAFVFVLTGLLQALAIFAAAVASVFS